MRRLLVVAAVLAVAAVAVAIAAIVRDNGNGDKTRAAMSGSKPRRRSRTLPSARS
jgi:Spy/CpxP family protein refolding chaperone